MGLNRTVVLLCLSVVLSACDNRSASTPTLSTSSTSTPTPTPTPSPLLTPSPSSALSVSGSVSYDFVPHTSRGALDFDNISIEPIKGARVQLLNASDVVVSETLSSATGAYSLDAEEDTVYKIRVRAQLLSAEDLSWDISVTDNTDSNALYVMDGTTFNSGAASQVRDLHASSGWSVSDQDYTGERVAAPFAILDSAYQLLATLRDQGLVADLPATELRWSTENINNFGTLSEGEIGTSFYDTASQVMYLLGDKASDTDEYDRSVIQHEMTHYLEGVLSRSDSIGGSHGIYDRLDMRVAFSEGLANAVTALASESGFYEDAGNYSEGEGFNFSLEERAFFGGWYNEGSVGNILYDIGDDALESGDKLDLGLVSLIEVLNDEAYRQASSLTSLYLFMDRFEALNSSEAFSALEDLLADHNIYGRGEYGEGETNDGDVSVALPVYIPLDLAANVTACSRGDSTHFYNALDVRRFIRFTLSTASSYRILIETNSLTTGSKNPDAFLFKDGVRIFYLNSSIADSETLETYLSAGDYILEVYDRNNEDGSDPGLACFDVSVELG